ncbi:mitochondrial import inner membrane translocase subunit TIM22 [Tribonema minus]|uniref:Mitochondrial import inner membrane translocase subunit TIM22 n=1 Tax=Tribonema minus TaxID=303371 RepID=A0A836C710_9STRA|nr:mitochondrial import inner membrane translocase subunit TIM22 [Tribonema minus]
MHSGGSQGSESPDRLGRWTVGGGLSPSTEQELGGRPLLLKFLPTVKAWDMRTGGTMPPQPPALGESCGARLIMGTAGGFGMGLLFGMFLGAMGDMQPIQVINGREVPQAPLGEQARAAYLGTKSRSLGMAKNFASFSAIFMASECVIEKMRGKHDMMNSVYGGCITGMAFGIKAGPKEAVGGCLGMAAFSAVIDAVMGH